MIGAMPAVAVRHERQKQNRQQGAAFGGTGRDTLFSNGVSTHHVRRSSRPVRPNHLPLGNRQRICSSYSSSSVSSIMTPSYLSPVPLSTSSTCATPVFTTSVTPRQVREPLTAEEMVTDYCCYGKFPLLHVIVISLLMGITLLIVGLVQLKPNADSEAKKYLFLGTAAVCFSVGFFSLAVRAVRRYQFRKYSTPISRRLTRDESSAYSFCQSEDPDRATPVDSIALLQQRF